MLLPLAMPLPMPVRMLVGQEKVLVEAVAREGDDGGAQAGEGVAETVEAGEAACVAPGFTISFHRRVSLSLCWEGGRWFEGGGRGEASGDVRALPGIVAGLAGGAAEGADVEARDVGLLGLAPEEEEGSVAGVSRGVGSLGG